MLNYSDYGGSTTGTNLVYAMLYAFIAKENKVAELSEKDEKFFRKQVRTALKSNTKMPDKLFKSCIASGFFTANADKIKVQSYLKTFPLPKKSATKTKAKAKAKVKIPAKENA